MNNVVLQIEGLTGGYLFFDGQMQDQQLGLWVAAQAEKQGVVIHQHCPVQAVSATAALLLQGESEWRQFDRLVNVAGPWSNQLLEQSGLPVQQSLDLVRGSHLLLPGWRLPVAQALTFLHRRDRRPVFVFPWEGATVVGTTDLDHQADLDISASISGEELDYLLAACAQQFPHAQVVAGDVLSTWSGVRPVVGSSGAQQGQPSNETREHVLWQEPGCVTLAGGKLTTFRPQAIEVLTACAAMLGRELSDDGAPVFAAVEPLPIAGLSASQWRRLAGRHGRDLPRVAQLIEQLGSDSVGATDTLWVELALACDTEMVLHLDDLLLRRTRLGLLLAEGGAQYLPAIRRLCQPRLGWDDARWAQAWPTSCRWRRPPRWQ